MMLPAATTQALEETCHSLIPISQAMGLRVDAYDGQRLRLSAPLANNINHQQSAFGGSLFSLSALAGWGILQLKMTELGLDTNTVIAGGDVSYDKPVFGQLICVCELPAGYTTFTEKLRERGKASLAMQTRIIVNDETAMTFSGKYVVLLTT
ncbi:MAG: YiiD C-terminal domain-containing protein [Pseudomonadales bacterium]|nr:YiiD C-terminal domain-containing protein [Pseudomonadales bacterium]